MRDELSRGLLRGLKVLEGSDRWLLINIYILWNVLYLNGVLDRFLLQMNMLIFGSIYPGAVGGLHVLPGLHRLRAGHVGVIGLVEGDNVKVHLVAILPVVIEGDVDLVHLDLDLVVLREDDVAGQLTHVLAPKIGQLYARMHRPDGYGVQVNLVHGDHL